MKNLVTLLVLLWGSTAMADPVSQYEWRFFTDQVMGGVSSGQVALHQEGLHLTGDVSTQNNGGFIQARADTGGFPASATGIKLRVKGDGQRYFIHLRSRATVLPWQYYQAAFDTDGTWQEITLPFDAFKASGALLPRAPAPQSVKSVALVAYGRDHIADVWLQAFEAY